MTLSPLKDKTFQITRISLSVPIYEPHPDKAPEEVIPQQRPNESEDDFWERQWNWENDWKVDHLVQPEPGNFIAPEAFDQQKGVNLNEYYSSTGLQIIVKLANIELTPAKPSYAGGAWHVEGQMVCWIKAVFGEFIKINIMLIKINRMRGFVPQLCIIMIVLISLKADSRSVNRVLMELWI